MQSRVASDILLGENLDFVVHELWLKVCKFRKSFGIDRKIRLTRSKFFQHLIRLILCEIFLKSTHKKFSFSEIWGPLFKNFLFRKMGYQNSNEELKRQNHLLPILKHAPCATIRSSCASVGLEMFMIDNVYIL
jgi:hypothetical protein